MGDSQNTLQYLWFLTKMLYFSLGVVFASENTCDDMEVTKCFDDLVVYESITFPLYGHDEASLDDTCGNIQAALDCTKSYYNTCYGSPECDQNCTDTLVSIGNFLANTGLERFVTDLCEEHSPLRETYLENVDCLMSNADEYARCHNDSQMSLSYISTLRGAKVVDAKCCYSSWYNHCFTNTTMRACGENATIFVSYAIQELVGDMSKFCAKSQISCATPPMSPLDEEKPNDKENEINVNKLNSAMVQLSVTSVILLSCFSVMLSTHIL